MHQPAALRSQVEEHRIGRSSEDLKRFDESHLLRDPRLSKAHRMTLILYYEWGFDLKEIGDVMGVTESRASQFLKAARIVQEKYTRAAEVYFENTKQFK